MVNVSGFVEALGRPVLVVDRSRWTRWLLGREKTYTGRILSHVEWLPFEVEIADVMRRQKAGEDVALALHDVLRRYFDAIGIPARIVFSLPTGAVVEVMRRFLALQASATKATPGRTSGSDSPQKDADAPKVRAPKEVAAQT